MCAMVEHQPAVALMTARAAMLLREVTTPSTRPFCRLIAVTSVCG